MYNLTKVKMQNYQSIYRDLLQQIRNGKLIPGLGLPGENSLAESYHVSRPTLRKALHLLADDGYVCCQPGVGWKVLRTSPVVPCDDRRITVGIDFGGEEWAMFYHEPFLRGMRKVAEVNHCALQLIDIDYKTGRISGEVDALALGKATKEHYPVLEKIAENIPVILFNRMPVEKKLAYISVDYRQASILPVEYLIRYGHRRIAVISQANSLVSQERVQGWRIALEENGISYSPDLIYSGNNISGLVDFLKRQKPTAVFIAIGVCVMPTLLALAQANLRIPDDVSVISFDDINGVQLNDHLLSCVKMPQEAMGEIAVNYLRNACTAPKTTPVLRQIMSPALFISESCAKR